MQNTFYDFTVPVFIKSLGGLKSVLMKAREHGLTEAALFDDRLAPDMFPFVKQVQMACDHAKGAAARLAGVEVPSFEDTEKTFDELFARIDKTAAFVQSVPQTAFEQAAQRSISLPYWKGKTMSGLDYARYYALPNFFFHATTAYDLVRKQGVAIGKADYINGLPLQDPQ